jgi:hypothetical protein
MQNKTHFADWIRYDDVAARFAFDLERIRQVTVPRSPELVLDNSVEFDSDVPGAVGTHNGTAMASTDPGRS